MSRRLSLQARSRRGGRAATRRGSAATTRSARKTAAATLACASLLAAAGCAASGVHDGAGADSTQAARGVRPLPTPHGPGAQGGAGAGPAGTRALGSGSPGAGAVGPTGTQRARRQQGMIDDEVSSSGAKPADPCALIDRAGAQKMMGTEVRTPVLAPQGPTCIYAARSSRRQVTLAIQGSPPKGPPPQDELSHRMRVKVGGRHAFCGVAGVPTLIVPLRGGRFLTVAAPCPIAAAFAGRALARLGSR